MTPKLLYYLDDDSDDLEFFKEAADNSGHHTMLFHNGHEMLLVLRTVTKKPDIIFLDIHMPILNGMEMLDVLKKSDEWKDIPVVMLSGAYPKKLVRHFLDVGANYLMKKSPDLKNMLDEAIEATLNAEDEMKKTA